MTVKIDRYKAFTKANNDIRIYDFLFSRDIVYLDTHDKELNKKLSEAILEILNE